MAKSSAPNIFIIVLFVAPGAVHATTRLYSGYIYMIFRIEKSRNDMGVGPRSTAALETRSGLENTRLIVV